MKELVALTDYVMTDKHIDGVNQTFFDWEHNKYDNIMTFRDQSHASLMTGTMAPAHHTPWLKALDDSKECYLATQPKEAGGAPKL